MPRPRKHRLDLPERVYFRNGAYYFVHYTGKWQRLDSNYAKAMAAWSELLQHADKLMVMNDVFDKYARLVIPQKAERTQVDNLKELRFLRAFFGQQPVECVLPEHVADYRDSRIAKTRCNRELALLSHVFKYAIEWGAAKTNPVKSITKNKEKPRDRFVEDHEVEAFKEHCPQWLRTYLDLKLQLGLRQRDLLNLVIGQVLPDRVVATLGKTGKRLAILRTSQLDLTLDALPKNSQALFASSSGEAFTSSGFASSWQRAMAKYVASTSSACRFTEHDLRGKVATEIGDPHRAQKLLGHKNIAMTERYIKARQTDVVMPHTKEKSK